MSALEQEAKVIKNKVIEVCYVVCNKSARGNQIPGTEKKDDALSNHRFLLQ